MPEDITPTKSILTGSLLIGYITLLGYTLAFIYEFSFSNYFGIPHYFIDITLVNIFVAISLLGIYIFFIKQLCGLFETFGLVKDTAIGRFRMKQLLLIAFMVPQLYSLYKKDNDLIYIAGGYIILVVLYEILQTLLQRAPTWKEKRRKLELHWSKTSPENSSVTLSDKFFGKIFSLDKGIFPTELLPNAFFFCFLVFILGRLNAATREEFYTLSTSPDRVVITQYSGSLFTLSYNTELKTFNKDLRIIGTHELFHSNIDLILEKIGPLEYKESTNNTLEPVIDSQNSFDQNDLEQSSKEATENISNTEELQ